MRLVRVTGSLISKPIFGAKVRVKLSADPKIRFSGRAEYYAKYRPKYPKSVLAYMEQELRFSRNSVVADVGSGTGIFAEMLLENGNTVFGIEPNDDMRTIAEANLSSYRNFKSVKGSAEATTLPPASVDFVTAAQSFHWFDRKNAYIEFRRILKKAGWVVLIWNTRRTSTPFLEAYDRIVEGKMFEDRRARHEDLTEEVFSSFLGKHLAVKLSTSQECDEEALKGRVLSASYSPLPGDQSHQELLNSLSKLFKQYQVNGLVKFEYDTEVYRGSSRDPCCSGTSLMS